MLNKPIYLGFTVLKLSKWLMYDFHYNFILKKFNAKLLLIDTDSLSYEIKSEDCLWRFFSAEDLFDFSNYPKNSKFFDEANKKVKKPKMYSLKKLIIKNVIQQYELVLQLSLINLKMFYLIKKY